MKTIKINELREILLSKKAKFQYKKKDGTIREAYGTMQFTFIPEKMQPKDASSYFEFKNIRYFDLELEEWRSISDDVEEVTIL